MSLEVSFDDLPRIEASVKPEDINTLLQVWEHRRALFNEARGAHGTSILDRLVRVCKSVQFQDDATEAQYQRWDAALSRTVRKTSHGLIALLLVSVWGAQPAAGFELQAFMIVSMIATFGFWGASMLALSQNKHAPSVISRVAWLNTGIGVLVLVNSLLCTSWCWAGNCVSMGTGLYNGAHHITIFVFLLLHGFGLSLQVPDMFMHMGAMYCMWFGLFIPRFPVSRVNAAVVPIAHFLLFCVVIILVHERHVTGRLKFHLLMGLSQQLRTNEQAMQSLAAANEETVVARVKAEKATLMRQVNESMVGYVCHQLRNPLHSVRAATNQLQSNCSEGAPLTGSDVECVGLLHEATSQLEKVTSYVMDFQRLPTSCPVSVSMAQDVPVSITADSGRVVQLLSIGLHNAMKHRRDESAIRLMCKLGKDAAGATCLRFEVWNEGEGLGMMDIRQAFEPFSWTVGQSGSSPSVGLGLPISRLLSDFLGGEVGLEDRGRHTVYWFTLPLAKSPDALRPLSRTPSERQTSTALRVDQPWIVWSDSKPFSIGQQLHVLIVDDLSTNRKLLAAMAARLRHSTNSLEDGDQIVEYLDNGAHVDLVLLDIHMVRSDGRDIVRTLRSLGYTIMTIAVTGNVSEADLASYQAAGFDGVLGKPFALRDLAKLVDHLSRPDTALLTASNSSVGLTPCASGDSDRTS